MSKMFFKFLESLTIKKSMKTKGFNKENIHFF